MTYSKEIYTKLANKIEALKEAKRNAYSVYEVKSQAIFDTVYAQVVPWDVSIARPIIKAQNDLIEQERYAVLDQADADIVKYQQALKTCLDMLNLQECINNL